MRAWAERMNGIRFFILIVLVMGLVGCTTERLEPLPPAAGPGGVKFSHYEPQAQSVAVAGAFNGWAPDNALMVQDAGLWMVTIVLQPGEHPFMYVIDGKQWITPPQADDFVPDGFGQTNGVVIVP